jgi:hypothetical protein
VQVQVTDFNGADAIFAGSHFAQWTEISASLAAVPLHLKASDQARKIGAPIWDAVGNNAAIRTGLEARGWQARIPIPAPFKFLGTDVDFVKDGAAIEVQFSNYPFLLNNLLRCELFFKGRIQLDGAVIQVGAIITKAKMFDASNSTLYYEQAVNQLSALAANNVFDVPLRLVGLFEPYGPAIPVEWTTYAAPRYSRTISNRRTTTARIEPGAHPASRAVITVF